MQRIFWVFALILALAGCGGGASQNPLAQNADSEYSNSGGSPHLAADPVSNIAELLVDEGPDKKGVNRLFTSVTICQPGSTLQCQTIDHVLVDTGSVGLRLLAAEVSEELRLRVAKNTEGNALLGCAKFLDGSFAWGPLALADVKLAGLTAANTPIQLVGHPAYGLFQNQCSTWGDSINTAADLGANGILGVGLSKQDCGRACEPLARPNAANGKYFVCKDAACTSVTGTTLASDQQLQQVVARFATDNNGFAIQMDSVPQAGAAITKGKMIFGLGTRANNQYPTLQVLATNSNGLFNGELSGSNDLAGLYFPSTFLDTGSNGIYFDTYLPRCGLVNYIDFYCPPADVNFNVLLGNAAAARSAQRFTLGNAFALFRSGNSALPTLGGILNAPGLLDLGLPFFYGKTVLIGIDGMPASGVGNRAATGPFYAL